jgi:hypothetical protein
VGHKILAGTKELNCLDEHAGQQADSVIGTQHTVYAAKRTEVVNIYINKRERLSLRDSSHQLAFNPM